MRPWETPGRCGVCGRPLEGLRAYEVVATPCEVRRTKRALVAHPIPGDRDNFRTEGFLCVECMMQFRDLIRGGGTLV